MNLTLSNSIELRLAAPEFWGLDVYGLDAFFDMSNDLSVSISLEDVEWVALSHKSLLLWQMEI